MEFTKVLIFTDSKVTMNPELPTNNGTCL